MRTREVTCERCGEARWTNRPRPYTCQRCTDVLAGKPHVVDPLRPPAGPPTERQQAARDAFSVRQKGGSAGLGGPESGPSTPESPQGQVHEGETP